VEMTQGELLDTSTRPPDSKGKPDSGADFNLVAV
jgi:hypothetical protein